MSGGVCENFNWTLHAYCTLSSLYTQRMNRRHHLVGHLFQGRYKAFFVPKEAYLLVLTRYVVLNPCT